MPAAVRAAAAGMHALLARLARSPEAYLESRALPARAPLPGAGLRLARNEQRLAAVGCGLPNCASRTEERPPTALVIITHDRFSSGTRIRRAWGAVRHRGRDRAGRDV